jgi:two-component system KDP operon response regulator KdpE
MTMEQTNSSAEAEADQAQPAPPCALIVQERRLSTPWIAAVQRLGGGTIEHEDGDPARVRAAIADGGIDVLLLDGRRGWVEGWMRRLRGVRARPPMVVVLQAWSSGDAASLLRHAADDVVRPDVDCEELCARLHALLRRIRASSDGVGLARARMRRAELRLLEYLRAYPGRVVPQKELLDNVFGGAHAANTSLVRVHVSRLRKALGHEVALRTVPGVGYTLEVPPSSLRRAG